MNVVTVSSFTSFLFLRLARSVGVPARVWTRAYLSSSTGLGFASFLLIRPASIFTYFLDSALLLAMLKDSPTSFYKASIEIPSAGTFNRRLYSGVPLV